MKRTLLVLVAAALTSTAFSQFSYGIQAMGNASKASIKTDDAIDPSSKMQIGMGAGFVAEYAVSEHFGVRGSLNWLQKKSKIEFTDPDFSDKLFSINSTLNYVELPLHAVYKIPLNNATLFAGIGPSFGYGFSGKLKTNGWIEADGEGDEILSIPYSFEIDAFKKEADDGAELKRFEISGSAIAGVSFKNGLFVQAGYLHGFTNLASEGTYRNRGLLLTVGFMIH